MGFNKDCHNLVSLKMSLSSAANGLPNEIKMSSGIQHSWHYRGLNKDCHKLVSLKITLSSATNGLCNEIRMSSKYSTLLKLQEFK